MMTPYEFLKKPFKKFELRSLEPRIVLDAALDVIVFFEDSNIINQKDFYFSSESVKNDPPETLNNNINQQDFFFFEPIYSVDEEPNSLPYIEDDQKQAFDRHEHKSARDSQKDPEKILPIFLDKLVA